MPVNASMTYNNKSLLSLLTIADPETAEFVIAGFQRKKYTITPEIADILVNDVAWGLSIEISLGRAIASGYISLAPEVLLDKLYRYSSLVRKAGTKGPTLGKIIAESLVPVLKYNDNKFVDKFLSTVIIMENKGVYVLNSPLNALSVLLKSRDFESTSALLELYSSVFSCDLSYNRCKQLAFILPKSILGFSKSKRSWQIKQLHRVIKVDLNISDIFLEGMNNGLHLLSEKALDAFVLNGLNKFKQNPKLGTSFLSLTSKLSIDIYDNICLTAQLVNVQQRLNRYLRARINAPVIIRSMSEMPELYIKDNEDKPVVCSDGRFIYLPDEIDIFESKAKNMEIYKYLVKLEAGYYEFNTFDFDLEKITGWTKNLVIQETEQQNFSDMDLFFLSFPVPKLAADLFLIFEHGRLKKLFSIHYSGLHKRVMPILQQEAAKIIIEKNITGVVFLLYAWIALDIHPDKLISGYNGLIKKLSEIIIFFNNKIKEKQNVEICAELIIEFYNYIETITNKIFLKTTTKQNYRPIKIPFGRKLRPELFFAAHKEDEKRANKIKLIIEKNGYKVYKSEIRKHLIDNNSSLSLEDIKEIIISSEKNRSANEVSDQNIVVDLSGIDFSEVLDMDVADTSVENHGHGSIYRYKEWDCTVNDYIHNHVRVLHREIAGCEGNFYGDTIKQKSGLVKRIRNSFELLKPSELTILRRWIEGDEFDYRELLNFAIDKKSGLIPSDRLYIKREKQNRDVAVLLLVDLSRSTANMVAESNKTVLDIEKEAIVLFCEALDVIGDSFSIAGFSGTGRLGVDYFCVKNFDDKVNNNVKQKINALAPQRSTRMGAAIRHAVSILEKVRSKVRLLLIIGDGFPNDTGYKQNYAIKDTRMAILEADSKNIHAQALTINLPGDYTRLDDLFGPAHHNVISDVNELPDRLLQIYKMLTK